MSDCVFPLEISPQLMNSYSFVRKILLLVASATQFTHMDIDVGYHICRVLDNRYGTVIHTHTTYWRLKLCNLQKNASSAFCTHLLSICINIWSSTRFMRWTRNQIFQVVSQQYYGADLVLRNLLLIHEPTFFAVDLILLVEDVDLTLWASESGEGVNDILSL